MRRHEAVHRPENAEKRRRPRRGLLPPSRPGLEGEQGRSLSTSKYQISAISMNVVNRKSDAGTPVDQNDGDSGDWTEVSDDIVSSTCACHVQDGTVCVHCSSELVRLTDGRIAPKSQAAIMFCMTHYIQSQLKWFPFIRPAALRVNWLQNGRALILAALGARAIKEYKALSGLLWAEAVSRQAAWAPSSISDSDNILSDFQTKLLLLEYLHWSEDDKYPAWVGPMLDEMSHREAGCLVDMLSGFSSRFCAFRASRSLEDEFYRQEIRWTLWKLYSTVTRTTLFGLKLHPPPLFQTLGLPGDPRIMLKLAESAGNENEERIENLRSEFCDSRLTLPQALSMLLADQESRVALADMLSMTGKYIMLHAILYLTDTMIEEPAKAEQRGDEPLGWRVEPREQLYLLVRRWRQCFWIPPEVLFKNLSFPDFGIHQTIMLVIYLAVRISQPTGDCSHKERYALQPYAQYAMRCVISMHVDMKHSNLFEVSDIAALYIYISIV